LKEKSEISKFKIGEKFKPSPKLKNYYYTIILLLMAFVTLPWAIPLIFFIPITVWITVTTPMVAFTILLLAWARKYYDTIFYKLTENEIIWERGVFIKNTGVVPYNRVTNIDVLQGPIARKYGIASLKIQTAGYSGAKIAEITIEGIENYEELRDLIISYIKGKPPVAVETYEEKDINARILEELTAIRKLLEKMLEKTS